jgi:hypothetical protein
MTDIRIRYQSNITTYTHTPPHTFTHDINVHTWPKKRTHRNYQPCLPHRHYGCHNLCFNLLKGRTSHAVGHGLILLMMGIIMPETCWDRKFDNKHWISCILLVLYPKIMGTGILLLSTQYLQRHVTERSLAFNISDNYSFSPSCWMARKTNDGVPSMNLRA